MKIRPALKKDLKLRGEFLFEIGCEEIPAQMISRALQELKALLQKYFITNGLLEERIAQDSIEAFGAPRRLAAIARGVRMRQEDVTREITGPPKAVAYDAVGEPTRAAMSFAEKQGVAVSKLTIVNTPKGEYLAAKQTIIGRPAADI
ncbi:MAG: glycine--tRNA ligase subunit beta, partial [Candidatus Acidiferrales bacterium]